MKKYPLYFLLAFMTVTAALSCGSGMNDVSIAPGLVTQKVQEENLSVIDVRTEEEFAAGHIAGAKLIDVTDPSFVREISKLDKSKGYLVYCKSGVRSKNALEIMKNNGFNKVYHMDGGFDAWEGPVEK